MYCNDLFEVWWDL